MALTFQDRGLKPEGMIVLTQIVEEEGEQFVSYCLELGTASCGDTIEEALHNLEEAIEVHLNALEETGEWERVFREKNITIRPLSPQAEGVARLAPPTMEHAVVTLPLGKLAKATPHKVPAGL